MTLRILLILLSCLAVQAYDVGVINASISLLYVLTSLLIISLLVWQTYTQFRTRQKTQYQAVTEAKQHQDAKQQEMILQQETQDLLEMHVQERTLELNIALQELEEANRELEKKNTLDELSGLYNRRFYDQKIMAEYRRSKRNLTSLSLVIIDIDHFKRVNDNYGHLAGDQCITWVAKQIMQCLKRPADICCRYGGEEFCLILPETNGEGARLLAETIRASIAEHKFVYQNETLDLTVSCGLATYDQQNRVSPEHIFSTADQALYQAKQNGRNQLQTLFLSDLDITLA